MATDVPPVADCGNEGLSLLIPQDELILRAKAAAEADRVFVPDDRHTALEARRGCGGVEDLLDAVVGEDEGGAISRQDAVELRKDRWPLFVLDLLKPLPEVGVRALKDVGRVGEDEIDALIGLGAAVCSGPGAAA